MCLARMLSPLGITVSDLVVSPSAEILNTPTNSPWGEHSKAAPALPSRTSAAKESIGFLKRRPYVSSTLMMSASPWPPPPQSAAAPYSTSPTKFVGEGQGKSITTHADRVTHAIAPPLTFTISSLTPRSFIDAMPTAANASFNSNNEMSSRKDRSSQELL